MSDILRYVSKSGEFGMGGSDHVFFRLSAVLGLSYPDVERQTVIFSGRSGESTIATRFLPRAITVCGDVIKKDGLKEIIRILAECGTLYINTPEGERETSVIATSMEEPQKIGDVTRVVIQFVADDPAFLDSTVTRVGIFERVDLVQGACSLPCVFTTRVNGGDFENTGDLYVEPKITIYSRKAEGKTVNLLLENTDTNAKICLAHNFAAGEIVTIDTKNAKITDGSGNSLLSAISDDTYLSEFVLQKGKNTINVVVSDISNELQVVCEYKKKHLEAMI